MRISPHFMLEEFLVSQTATRHGINMDPPADVADNIVQLVKDVLEPLRIVVGPLLVSSGYRPSELNTLIGGSKTSAHRFGCAADFRSNKVSPLDLCKKIVELELPFDQVIHEFGRWVHVGIRWDIEPYRFQKLTAYKDTANKTVYVPGLRPMSEFL